MKKQRIYSLLLCCGMLTAAMPVMPVLPAYAAETEADATEAPDHHDEMLTRLFMSLNDYGADFFAPGLSPSADTVYRVTSEALQRQAYLKDPKHSPESFTVSFSEFFAAADQQFAQVGNSLKEYLLENKLYNRVDDAVIVAASQNTSSEKVNIVFHTYDLGYGEYLVTGALCSILEGKLPEGFRENYDYITDGLEHPTYYRIETPCTMMILKTESSYRICSYQESADYVIGDALYHRTKTDEKTGCSSADCYLPVELTVQAKVTDEDAPRDAEYYLNEYNDKIMLDTSDGDLDYRMNFDGKGTALIFDRLWRKEDAKIQMEAKLPENCALNITCTDAKGGKKETVYEANAEKPAEIAADGAAKLNLVFEATPEAVEKAKQMALIGRIAYFQGDGNASYFYDGEDAPDALVYRFVAEKLYFNEEFKRFRPADLEFGNSFTVPYADFISLADRYFAQHSDLKSKDLQESFGDGTPIYDAAKNTMKIICFGGSGGGAIACMKDVYYVGDEIHVTALYGGSAEMLCYQQKETDVRNIDYFYQDDSLFVLYHALEMVLKPKDGDYQIVSYYDPGKYVLEDHLYVSCEGTGSEPKIVQFEPVDVQMFNSITQQDMPTKLTVTGENTCTVSDESGDLKVNLTFGNHEYYKGMPWITAGSPLSYEAQAPKGVAFNIAYSEGNTVSGLESGSYKPQGKVSIHIQLQFPKSDYQPTRGDLDDSGTISAEDAQLVLNAYTELVAGNESGLTAAQIKAADINADGEVNSADAQLILMYYVQNTVAGIPTTWEQLLGE